MHRHQNGLQQISLMNIIEMKTWYSENVLELKEKKLSRNIIEEENNLQSINYE